MRRALAVTAVVPLLLLGGCDDGGAEPEPTTPVGQGADAPTEPGQPAPDDEGERAGTTAAPDGAPATEHTVDPTGPAADLADDPEVLAAALLGASVPAPTGPTERGRVATIDAEIEVGVLDVLRLDEETVLVWAMRSADGDTHPVRFMRGLDDSGNDPQEDVRAVRLRLPDEELLLTSTLGDGERERGRAVDCLCSRLPDRITGDWVVLRNSYGPLPDGVETVTVELPGVESYDKGISLEVEVTQDGPTG